MKLGFFTMPIHPVGKDWRQCLREDREAFLLADELGYCEAYTGEHSTDLAENITSCTMFLSSLAGQVKQITLGTGTVNMPNTQDAFFDDLRARVAAVRGTAEGLFDVQFTPDGSHRPYWLTRPAVLWLERSLGFARWDAAAIRALPDGRYSFADVLDNDGITDEPLTIGRDAQQPPVQQTDCYFVSSHLSIVRGSLEMKRCDELLREGSVKQQAPRRLAPPATGARPGNPSRRHARSRTTCSGEWCAGSRASRNESRARCRGTLREWPSPHAATGGTATAHRRDEVRAP